MQMPDGEVVGLPANSKGLTVLPEIGQESQWSVQSHPMEVADLCNFLMSREQVRRQREAMPDLASGSAASTATTMKTVVTQGFEVFTQQHWTPMQAPSMRMAPVSLRADAKDGESAGVSVDNYSGQVGADSSIQVPSRMAQSEVIDHNRLQPPCFDGDSNELSELPWDASQEWREGVNASLELKQFEWREVVNASLESYEEEEARRAAREAKLEAQEESDLISAAGASLYEGKRDQVEQAATSAHMATQFAVMRTRHDRATGDEESDRRKEAHQEEERN